MAVFDRRRLELDGVRFSVGDDGAVVLAGLGNCGEYSRYNSSAPLPAGVFVARKGFDYGWMDVEGNWVYCQSIFTSTSDETNNYFY